jgi:hypothetical protein
MATAIDIMRGGFSAGSAKAINGQIAPTVSGAGTVIGDATNLVASINVVTTVAASSGVQLPNGEIGDEVEILNLGANALTVYPDTTSNRINALSAGSGFLLATNTAVKLRKYTTLRWIGYLSA